MTRSFSECWDFTKSGKCPRGNKCKWEHVKQEESARSPAECSNGNPDPNEFCWNYLRTGCCPRGNKCNWIHDLILMPTPYMGPSLSFPSLHSRDGAFAPEVSTSFNDLEDDTAIPTTPEGRYWAHFGDSQTLYGTTSSYDPMLAQYTAYNVGVDQLSSDRLPHIEGPGREHLPSEMLALLNMVACDFCNTNLGDTDNVISHFESICLNTGCDSSLPENTCNSQVCSKLVATFLKRKSWIVLQESLPNGFVSQVEGVYKRQITSSTNLINILDSIKRSRSIDEDTRRYLSNELVSLIVTHIVQSFRNDEQKRLDVKYEIKNPTSSGNSIQTGPAETF